MAPVPAGNTFARKWRRLIQSYGPRPLKRLQWDREFRKGHWDFLADTSGDPVYAVLEKYAKGGRILDLGCGLGNTPNEMAEDSYASYMGVDISMAAILKARARTERNGRGHNTRFAQGDVASFDPEGKFDVILFRDSIYYTPLSHLEKMLRRYTESLNEQGVIVVRIVLGLKSVGEIEWEIQRHFRVIEHHRTDSPGALILVFR